MSSIEGGFPGSPYTNSLGSWDTNQLGQWAQDHYIDPETGLLMGPYPLPPHNLARGYQALHDRAIWQYRRRLMDEGRGRFRAATQMQQGALGLLQSFRPGGSAALEAGIYDSMAGGLRAEGAAAFNQAQMTQPLDLLSDVRRHERVEMQRRADRQAERSMWTQIGVALLGGSVSSAQGYIGSGSWQGNSGGFTGGNDGSGGQAMQSQVQGPGGSAAAGAGNTLSSYLEPDPVNTQSPLTTPGPQGQQQPQQQGSPFQSQPQNDPLATDIRTENFDRGLQVGPGGPGMPGQPQPVQSQLPGGGGAGPGGGAGAGLGVMPSSYPGVAGDFSQETLAGTSAINMSTLGPAAEVARIGVSNFLVDLYESDPFYQSLPNVLDQEWKRRMTA